nr:MAG TPA: hypothetical protein [Caudoviricetes sp.]
MIKAPFSSPPTKGTLNEAHNHPNREAVLIISRLPSKNQ